MAIVSRMASRFGQQIFFDGQPLKDTGFLGQVPHAEAGAFIHRQLGDVVALEIDGAALGDDHADAHPKRRCFAGPVSTQKPHNGPLADRDADLVYDGSAGILFHQSMCFQKRLVNQSLVSYAIYTL
jgi:hypothetical protein